MNLLILLLSVVLYSQGFANKVHHAESDHITIIDSNTAVKGVSSPDKIMRLFPSSNGKVLLLSSASVLVWVLWYAGLLASNSGTVVKKPDFSEIKIPKPWVHFACTNTGVDLSYILHISSVWGCDVAAQGTHAAELERIFGEAWDSVMKFAKLSSPSGWKAASLQTRVSFMKKLDAVLDKTGPSGDVSKFQDDIHNIVSVLEEGVQTSRLFPVEGWGRLSETVLAKVIGKWKDVLKSDHTVFLKTILQNSDNIDDTADIINI